MTDIAEMHYNRLDAVIIVIVWASESANVSIHCDETKKNERVYYKCKDDEFISDFSHRIYRFRIRTEFQLLLTMDITI